ncbi:flavodoxin domain-containing protein [Paenibacillus caui]|uniref:flavodoxin domain-containing protein n=1 Tax=Paenibacillus caui TaxID=2873927 RepID=UPI001CA8862F|nr:flavodoxin domain-containing protein [Paenibacillus caui]
MATLIMYTTKHGTTEKAVNLLKQKLAGMVHAVNISREKVPALEGYDTVIIGGSIYMGHIQKELTKCINKYLPTLLAKKVGLFICAGHPDSKMLAKEMKEAFPAALYEHAIAKEIFGYEFNYSKLHVMEKWILKQVAGVKASRFALSEAKIDGFCARFS